MEVKARALLTENLIRILIKKMGYLKLLCLVLYTHCMEGKRRGKGLSRRRGMHT
jgi:hypothetical protein